MKTAHLTSLEDKGKDWEGLLVISEQDDPATLACDSEGFRPVSGDTLTVGSPHAAARVACAFLWAAGPVRGTGRFSVASATEIMLSTSSSKFSLPTMTCENTQ